MSLMSDMRVFVPAGSRGERADNRSPTRGEGGEPAEEAWLALMFDCEDCPPPPIAA